jgi:hypothetical protein
MNENLFRYIKVFIEMIKKHLHTGHALSFLIVFLLSLFVFFVRIPPTWNIHWYIAYITVIMSVIGFLLYRVEFENRIKIPQSFEDLKKLLKEYQHKINEMQSELKSNMEEMKIMFLKQNRLEEESTKVKLRIQTLQAKSNISLTDQEEYELNSNKNRLQNIEHEKKEIIDRLENIESENVIIKENIINEKSNMRSKTHSKQDYENAKSKEYGYRDNTFLTQLKSYLKSLSLLFGFVFIVILSGYLYMNSDTKTQSNMALLMSTSFLVIGFYLLYKIRYNKNEESNQNKFVFAKLLTEPFVLMYNIGYLTYCKVAELINKLLNNEERIIVFQSLIKWFNQNKKVFIVIVACIIFLVYEFSIPIKRTDILSKQLVNKPIYLNTSKVIGNVDILYGKSTRRNYTFSLQAWIYIDQNIPSKNMASNSDSTILNYGGVPLVTFNAKQNTLIVSIKQGANVQKPIFETQNLQLQKWNYIVFNYTNGTMDVFLNTNLVATENTIVPFMTKDEITSGSNDGINGGIQDVYYSKNPLSPLEIWSTYYCKKASHIFSL